MAPDANSMSSFGIRSYCHFIRGEDDSVNNLDSEFLGKLEAEKVTIAETISNSEKVAAELEAKLDALRKGPSKKEALEKVKSDLEKDVNKFRTMVAERSERTRLKSCWLTFILSSKSSTLLKKSNASRKDWTV